MRLFAAPLAAAALAAPAAALAQDPVDVGVLHDSEIHVVQKLLYPKAGRSELGLHLGWMPFDTYTTTPLASFTYGRHASELLGWEVALSGGYGLKNAAYRQLESPAYGIEPDAYRFLGAAVADLQWSPIYAKMNWLGRRVIHHDVYGLAGLGATVEQAMMPDHGIAVGPTVALGAGVRVFTPKGAIRLQLRDDLLLEKRVKTADTKAWFLKQNVAVTVGWSRLSGGRR